MNSSEMDSSLNLSSQSSTSSLPLKGKAIVLRDSLYAFADKFDRDLLIEIFVEQGLVSVHIFIVQVVLFMVLATIANDIKSIHAGISNIQGRLCVIHGQHLYIENFIL